MKAPFLNQVTNRRCFGHEEAKGSRVTVSTPQPAAPRIVICRVGASVRRLSHLLHFAS